MTLTNFSIIYNKLETLLFSRTFQKCYFKFVFKLRLTDVHISFNGRNDFMASYHAIGLVTKTCAIFSHKNSTTGKSW